MKKIWKPVPIALIGCLLLSACASETVIRSFEDTVDEIKVLNSENHSMENIGDGESDIPHEESYNEVATAIPDEEIQCSYPETINVWQYGISPSELNETVQYVNYSQFEGTFSCFIRDVNLYDNLEQAGLSSENIYLDEGTMYCGMSPTEVIAEQTAYGSRIKCLVMEITCTNFDARSDVSQMDYDNPYIFLAHSFIYLGNSGGLPNGWMTAENIQLCSLTGERPEHDLAFELKPGEEKTFLVGWFVDTKCTNLENLYLCDFTRANIEDGFDWRHVVNLGLHNEGV